MQFLKFSKYCQHFIILLNIWLILFFSACKSNEKPLPEKVQILIQRFDKSLFEANIKSPLVLDSLEKLYPFFYQDFVDNILGIPHIPENKQEISQEVTKFVLSYKELYKHVEMPFKDITNIESEFENGFQLLRSYLPEYQIPRLVAFIGPIDAIYQSWYGMTPDFINDSIIGISLLLHSGENLEKFKKNILADIYDKYLLKKFTANTIVPNCFKNIVEDIYADKSSSKNLINQIVEKGKKMYFVRQILPNITDTVLFGYSNLQLLNCKKFESAIWKFLLLDNNLYSKDPQTIRNFIGDAPFTTGLSKDIPGYLGLWVGYQIVESYMTKNPDKKLVKLMKMDNEKIFKSSNYKPKSSSFE